MSSLLRRFRRGLGLPAVASALMLGMQPADAAVEILTLAWVQGTLDPTYELYVDGDSVSSRLVTDYVRFDIQQPHSPALASVSGAESGAHASAQAMAMVSASPAGLSAHVDATASGGWYTTSVVHPNPDIGAQSMTVFQEARAWGFASASVNDLLTIDGPAGAFGQFALTLDFSHDAGGAGGYNGRADSLVYLQSEGAFSPLAAIGFTDYVSPDDGYTPNYRRTETVTVRAGRRYVVNQTLTIEAGARGAPSHPSSNAFVNAGHTLNASTPGTP